MSIQNWKKPHISVELTPDKGRMLREVISTFNLLYHMLKSSIPLQFPELAATDPTEGTA